MSIFLESPLAVIGMGSLMSMMLIAGLLKTGRPWLVLAIVTTVALTLGMVAVERMVVTTREEINTTLQEISDQLQRGAHAEVMRNIATEADGLKREATRWLPRITFHEVRVKRNLNIIVADSDHLTATFNAVMVLSEKSGAGDKHHVPSFFSVDFVHQPDGWKVTRYTRSDPRDGLGTKDHGS